MIIEYKEFIESLNEKLHLGLDFYKNLLITIIDNPSRYSGIFRLTNPKMKILQNVLQSQEIKFGDFIEDITTKYIEKLGYKNACKYFYSETDNRKFSVDQIFTDDDLIYLVEQKMRDDHDSTKKRGQFENFDSKICMLRSLHPQKKIIAIMWFVDNSLVKNKKYYLEQMNKLDYENIELHLYYGSEFFDSLKNGEKAWQELTNYLKRRQKETNNFEIVIPKFGSDPGVYDALLMLPQKYLDKLMSDDPRYVLIRDNLFLDGDNLKKACIAVKERSK